MTDYTAFHSSIQSEDQPDSSLRIELQALWLERAGDWDGAHDLCNEMEGKNGDWIHAYLHRVEGDQWNAEYWYTRAQQKMPSHLTLEEEWEALVKHFLNL